MFSPAIARRLRKRGHDVEPVAGHPEREAVADPDVLALARTERRGHQQSARPPLAPARRDHPRRARPLRHIFVSGGYRRTKADTGKIITALEAILTQHPGERDLATAKPGSNLRSAEPSRGSPVDGHEGQHTPEAETARPPGTVRQARTYGHEYSQLPASEPADEQPAPRPQLIAHFEQSGKSAVEYLRCRSADDMAAEVHRPSAPLSSPDWTRTSSNEDRP